MSRHTNLTIYPQMDRSDFVKSMLALTGTAFDYGCKSTVEDLTNLYSSPISKDAQDWFSNQYVKVYEGARTKDVSITRTLDWARQQIAKSNKHDFIWVPIEYSGDEKGTAILMWKEGEEYVQQLAQYLSWSIAEGFLIYRKPNGDYDGFLAQLAFDPQKSKPGSVVDPSSFTGLVVNADWNENILRSWRFLDGKLVNYYNPNVKNKGGRTKECITYYTQYSTMSGVSCGPSCIDVTYTLHNVAQTYCYGDYNSSDQGGYTGSGGYSPSNTGGGYTPPTTPTISPIVDYDLYKLTSDRYSWERAQFEKRLNESINAVGLGISTLDLSLSKATAIVSTLGFNANKIRVASVTGLTAGAKAVSFIGVGIGVYQVYVGFSDHDYSKNDWLTLGATALGVAAAFTPIGWFTVLVAGVSVGVSVYTTANPE
ncbi:hypothetical protein SAMN04488090_2629 [Siphonobacter aquaeclarae]|uniref:Uncharacterized protein n=2 Tax=Siphonobacter aquaeclarae TaxID=563176 RepID=A0A1G9QHK5_9BACT|nr:hypothetical protein SAMN04488090_2629 [Siphonobacter aquaeclarae]